MSTTNLLPDRDRHRAADDLIRAIYEKRAPWAAAQTAQQEKVKSALATVRAHDDGGGAHDDGGGALDAWQRLRRHLGWRRPDLLTIEPVFAALGPQAGNTGLDALLHLALCHQNWLRPPEEWEPASRTLPARDALGALARHLLARYPVPACLNGAWFEGFSTRGGAHRAWFVHVGGGRNIRTAPDCPVHLTKMQAHHFSQAPADFSLIAALRWGQVRGLGGGEPLAQAIGETRLEKILPDEPFWASVIHFFVNNEARMPASAVGPLVDFIFSQKFGDEPDNSDAPELTFSMKGRTLAALQKRVDEWHEQLAKDSRRPRKSWAPTGIVGFHACERDAYGTANEWTVRELLDSKSLQDEGREMRHCVFTYAGGCSQGTTSIWSLRVRPGNDVKTHRLLTIEVNNARRAIVQVRGRCNKTLGAQKGNARMRRAGEMLRRWAREARLSVACGL